MSNLIYAYRKKTENKIVYVGQSICIEQRHKQHVLYDPFNKKNKEYDYPLSRGIRKYGMEEYELLILEDDILLQDLDDREKYWIAYYDTYWHGYNQTIGGTYPTKPIYNDDIIKLTIDMLKKEEYSYKDISEKTGLSFTHIYNINTGARRPQDDISYPIRASNTKGTKGLKFSKEEIILIHKEILNTSKTFKDIAKEWSCTPETISKINSGKREVYKIDNYEYPLRKNTRSIAKINYWQKNK